MPRRASIAVPPHAPRACAGDRVDETPGRAPFAGQAERGAMVRRAVEHIEGRLAETVTLDDLAAHAGRSKYHLLRTFSREVGMPPHAYQTRARVLRARDLLESGVPPARAALETGFADQSHLTRHFKRLLGTTPGRYAREWQVEG